MIMSLLARVLTLHGTARLTRRKFLKARSRYTVQFCMLTPMCNYLVRVRTNEIALQTMEMRGFVLHRTKGRRICTLCTPARHVGSVLLKITAHKRVQTLMPCRMLNETRLVAKRVTTVLAHAMKMSLMFPVTAVWVPAIFVESEPVENKWKRFGNGAF